MIYCITVSKVSAAKTLVRCGNFNDHVKKLGNGCEGIHGTSLLLLKKYWRGVHTQIYCCSPSCLWELISIQTDNHPITYQVGRNCSQIDYILVRKSDLKQVCIIKVILGEEVVINQIVINHFKVCHGYNKCCSVSQLQSR